jgi:hypothetical protein
LDSDKELSSAADHSADASHTKPSVTARLRAETFIPFSQSASIRWNYFVTFAVCDPCFLKIRVGENSPNLCPTMFSVTNTD